MNNSELGYNKPLFILAFDHRASFSKNMFGISGDPNEEQLAQIKEFKNIIFEGFEKAVAAGVPKENAAILCDELYGQKVLENAHNGGYVFAMCTERSGQKEFMFEFGDKFSEHLQKYKAPFAKSLVRYNPEDEDQEMNKRQLGTLKILSDYCHSNAVKFLVEPLTPATKAQLEKVGGDQKRYDLEIRPGLMVEMVKQFQDAGVEPDVWKIEGLEKTEEYEEVIKQARVGGRDKVVAVILGRGADDAQVEKWLKAAAKAEGLVGFAIGRTIFHQALMDFKDSKTTREQAVEKIASNYKHFYQVFNQK